MAITYFDENGKPIKEVLIGEIEFDQSFLKEDRVDDDHENMPDLNKIGKCKVYVYPNEGLEDHFHIIGDGFETCVRIFSPRFYCHENHHKTLYIGNCKILNKWLKRKYSKNKEFTNWEFISYTWKNTKISNGTDLSTLPPMCDEQPDYSKMIVEPKDKWRECI